MFDIFDEIISSHFNVTVEELRGNSKIQRITDARHFLRYFLRIAGYSDDAIAYEYSTTKRNVRHSFMLIRDGITLQPFYAKHCKELQNELKELNILETN